MSEEKVSIAKIAVVFDQRRQLNNGNYPFRLRITIGKQQYYFKINLQASETLYTRLKGERLSDDAKKLKNAIKTVETKAEEVCKSLPAFSSAAFKKAYYQSVVTLENDLFVHFQQYIDDLTNAGRLGTARSYINAMRSIAAFVDGKMQEHVDRKTKGTKRLPTALPAFPLEAITVEWIKSYQAALEAVNTSVATIGIYLRSLRAIYNNAMKSSPELLKGYPFGKTKYSVRTSTKTKQPISAADIRRILEYSPASSTEALARDLWLFSYLLNGANFADVIKLKHSQVSRTKDALTISFVREKTKRGTKEVPISATFRTSQKQLIERIIADHGAKSGLFVFPFINEKQSPEQQYNAKQSLIRRVNKAFVSIGQNLDIPLRITTYVARHSYANNMMQSQAPLVHISQQLGHTNIITTQNYLHGFDTEAMQQYQDQLLDAGINDVNER